MGTMVYSLEWVMQDFVHQQYSYIYHGNRKSEEKVEPRPCAEGS